MEELPKAYEPQAVEEKWYRFWEEGNYFRADANSDKPAYCIVIPPPNVTGVLHMGHALVDTLQDVMIRFKRMDGFEALWVPGTDHAGIATQTVVERRLLAETGKRRTEFEREEFLKHVWDWKEKSERIILQQIKQIGCSCDWSRLRFTMDEGCNRAVRTIFKKLFDQGFIYLGDYLVNWDPVTQTALADDEVEYEDREGVLYFFNFPIDGSDEVIPVATTRPETTFGDTAIAVNEKDERYSHLIGKNVRHPLTQRLLPIIHDPFVKPEFGTGAVKITPAHDHNDYEMGLRHDLPMITMMTPDGKLNEKCGDLAGLSMKEGRAQTVKKLTDLGLFIRTEKHPHRVGLSYRSKAVIEPYLSKQWFVKLSAFKKQMRDAVEKQKVQLIPKDWESTYFHWIDNLRDWCISRQLWWGHRIPIWHDKNNPDNILCYDGEGVPPEVTAEPDRWLQDPDVLDTWFSSALWPFSTLGWPEKTPELAKFYPNSTLITGHDILFFWVARMIMMGEYALDQVPFPESFLHGLIYARSYWRVLDGGSIAYVNEEERKAFDLGEKVPADVHAKWEKMSKSKGNIIDPLEIVESYGADAMRMALCSAATHARQIDLDRRRFEEFKNFANKMWNGARFVFMNLEDLTGEELSKGLDEKALTLEDRWILSMLSRTIKQIRTDLDKYNFSYAAHLAYDFFWKEFCAYYVESVKPVLFGKAGDEIQRRNKQKMLVIVLCSAIRLLHPMAPFITEELFQRLKTRFGTLQSEQCDPYTAETITALNSAACIVSPYPKVIDENAIDEKVEASFSLINQIISQVRTIRTDMQIPPGVAIDLYLNIEPSDPSYQLIETNQVMIHSLVKIDKLLLNSAEKPQGLISTALVEKIEITVPLPDALREKEKMRLAKEQEKLIKQQNQTQSQLANEGFLQKAPKELIAKLQHNLEQARTQLDEISKRLEHL